MQNVNKRRKQNLIAVFDVNIAQRTAGIRYELILVCEEHECELIKS